MDEGAVGLTIAHNNVQQSINDGIGAFLDSDNNLISCNKAFNNAPFDCYDETAGPYPPGTANNWLKDMGFTQNWPGSANSRKRGTRRLGEGGREPPSLVA